MWIGFMWHKLRTRGGLSVNTIMNLMGSINFGEYLEHLFSFIIHRLACKNCVKNLKKNHVF